MQLELIAPPVALDRLQLLRGVPDRTHLEQLRLVPDVGDPVARSRRPVREHETLVHGADLTELGEQLFDEVRRGEIGGQLGRTHIESRIALSVALGRIACVQSSSLGW